MKLRAIPPLTLAIILALVGCSPSDGDDYPPRDQSAEVPSDDDPPPEDADPPEDPKPPEDSDPPQDPELANLPSLSVDDVVVAEADGTATFIVRATGTRTDDNLSVSYATVDGSATAGSDYASRSGTLMLLPEDSELTVEVDVLDDAEEEQPETFTLELDTAENAEIAEGVGEATIVDDDGEANACGEPQVEGGVATEALLWKDCAAGVWHFRVGAPVGEFRTYTGGVEAAGPFSEVTPVDVESSDTLNTADPTRIAFSLSVSGPHEDGFDFVTAEDAGSCFELSQPSDSRVVVGAGRTALTGAFDLETLAACGREPPGEPEQMNIVVVFADDQRFDTLQHMANVTARLSPQGVQFENAYVPTPLCCPARASTYSGGFLAQNTGVLENGKPNGGVREFNDRVNLGTKLQEAGYQTLFVGKWLNDYPLLAPYVPPGWNTFAGRAVWATGSGWSQFEYLIGSSRSSSSTGHRVDASGQYHVYFERDRIIDFLEEVPADRPFFLFWATTPPHPPAVPAPGDENAFADFTFRGRGYGEADLRDKPDWLQRFRASVEFSGDEAVRRQLQSMLAVDRSIGWILDTLAAQDKLDDTVFIITSDNGYMWGEHGLWGKNFAYEESLRVPLLVVMPGIEPRTDRRLVSAVLDLGPTLYDLAGVSGRSDGRSLVPLLRNPNVDWREELFFEKYDTVSWPNGLWAGVRRGNWKYVQYWEGDEELYDLNNDPYELENQVSNPAHEDVRARMAARLKELLGLSIKPGFGMPDGAVGEPYAYDFETWGGKPPYTWKIEAGALPSGLSLNRATGSIAGTPKRAGRSSFRLRVTSSDLATQAGRPKTFVTRELTLNVD